MNREESGFVDRSEKEYKWFSFPGIIMILPVNFSAEGNEAFTSINEYNCVEQII